MNAFTSTPVSIALGTSKAVAKSAKRPSKPVVVLTLAERVTRSVGLFDSFVHASGTLDEAKAYWDVARLALRDEMRATYAQYSTPKDWSAYLTALRLALVAGNVVKTPKAARTLVDNQVIALGVTGKTARKGAGGARKGSGRKEKTKGGASDVTSKAAQWNANALECVASFQSVETREDVLDMLGQIAGKLQGK